jgi:acetylornithine deacetylase/succinyl-diaminopimelate desuccinylase-like protein
MIPGESVKQVVEEITAILDDLGRTDPDFSYMLRYGDQCYKTEGTGVYEPSESSPESTIFKTIIKNQKELTGIALPPWGTPYSSDMRNLIIDGNVETVTFGPGMVERCHRPDEYVHVKEVLDVARILALTALDLLS